MEELQPRVLTADELSALRSGAAHRAAYLILGQRVHLAGNDRMLIDRFDVLYEAFRTDPTPAPDREILYHLAPPGEPYRWLVWSDGQAHEVTDPVLAQFPAVVFARYVLQALTSHYLVHSGCVSREGRAVVISGASGLGKSTLTAHLAAAGWDLLSDEFAPIRRRSRVVDPYPLRVGLRPGPGRDTVRGQPFIPLQFRSEDKQLVTVAQLAGGRQAAAAEVVAVIFLTTELTAEVATARRHRGVVRCWFTGWPDPLGPDLTRRFGVGVEGAGQEGELWWADLSMGDLTERLEDFRACARDHGVVLALVEYEDFGEKNYDAPPQCLRLPASAGVVELVKRMPGLARNAMINGLFGGKSAGLLLELAATLGGLRFYKLTPGRLADELQLVEAIWRGDV